MNRRSFLQSAGLGLAAASLPGWLQACSPGTPSTEGPGPIDGEPKSSAEALEFAKRNGRPLLVFIVPTDDARRYYRGSLLGVFLNHADDETMADLAMCSVWCAGPAATQQELAPGASVDDATVAVLIEPDDGRVATLFSVSFAEREAWRSRAEEEQMVADAKAHNEWLSAKLHALIAPDKSTLRRRAEQARAKFVSLTDPYSLGKMSDVDEPNASHVKYVPAWVRWRAENADAAQRATWTSMLAHEAVRRWRSAPLPGAHWVRSTGCAEEYEDGSNPWGMVACGMGFIPEYSSRFLTFFSKSG